jgi:hypothetical protein
MLIDTPKTTLPPPVANRPPGALHNLPALIDEIGRAETSLPYKLRRPGEHTQGSFLDIET